MLYVNDILVGTDERDLCKVKAVLSTASLISGNFTVFSESKLKEEKKKWNCHNWCTFKILSRFGMAEDVKKNLLWRWNMYLTTMKPQKLYWRRNISQVHRIMYLMLTMRSDLSTSVIYYSYFQSKITKKHWIGLKKILRYSSERNNKLQYDLVYRKTKSPTLIVYVDLDWAGATDRKSITGYLLEIFKNTVSWTTKKITMAFLSTEAEYVLLAGTASAHLVQKSSRWVCNCLRRTSYQCMRTINRVYICWASGNIAGWNIWTWNIISHGIWRWTKWLISNISHRRLKRLTF